MIKCSRNVLYFLAKLRGDFEAIQKRKTAKITKRAMRRGADKVTGRMMRKIFK